MKKRRLRKWVKVLLKVLFIASFILGASDCENMKVFIISHLIAVIVMLFSGYVLIKNMENKNE